MIPANWFVGLVVPPEGWFDELPPVPRGTRYFHRDDLHINLSFLGAVDEDAAMRAWRLSKLLSGGPFEFPLGQVDPVGPSRQPTAWAVMPDKPLEALNAFLASYRNDIAQVARARADMLPPRPYITVARPKRYSSVGERTQLAQWAEMIELPELTLQIREVALYTWSDEDDDRLFRIVDRFELPPHDASLWPARNTLRHFK